MNQSMVAFDVNKAEMSGRKIKLESDKLKRLSGNLKRAVESTPNWWAGGSQGGFVRRANELITLMNKAVDLVADLGEDMLCAAAAKKEEEKRLKDELLNSLSVGFGAVGALSAKETPIGQWETNQGVSEPTATATQATQNSTEPPPLPEPPTRPRSKIDIMTAEESLKISARLGLIGIAVRQYKWTLAANVVNPIFVQKRFYDSIVRMESNRSQINTVADDYGVPGELIGAIIFKEQLTQILPDSVANIDTFFNGWVIPWSTPTHSTGLGAIFPATARAAWAKIDETKVSGLSDKQLQFILSYNDDFNIETIAAVLVYEAMEANLIEKPSEAKNLTMEQWQIVVARYNGSGDSAEEYARKVYEYLPAVRVLLQ